jgi:DnaD/phage-associated family protein
MTPFAGFPTGKTRFTPLPDLLFSEVLVDIDDLAEIQVTLFMFWFINRQQGHPRYMTLAELEAEGVLLTALAANPADAANPVAALRRGVGKAVARGTLLQLVIEGDSGPTTYLLINTAQGRQAVEAVKRGELVLDTVGPVREPHIARPRPNIWALYEQNIGLLQPLLAQELEEAARDYPPAWIEEAFQIAVERNARHWRYIRAILERWATEGKSDAAGQRRPHRGA